MGWAVDVMVMVLGTVSAESLGQTQLKLPAPRLLWEVFAPPLLSSFHSEMAPNSLPGPV